MNVRARLREDVRTVFAKDPAAKSVWEVVCCYPGLHALWLHRLASALWRRRLLFLARAVSHFGRWLTGIEIHPGATIGRRFFIDHGMGVVIGETAEVGDDVLMYQGVVLGGTTLQKVKRHPTIGNDVVIGTGATVLGPIAVGDNARVGAGSVVIRSVPRGATVVGVPARLVGQPEPDGAVTDLEHGRLPDPVVKAISEAFDRQSRLEERLERLEDQLATVAPSVRAERLSPAEDQAELEDRVRAALCTVIDPEVGLSLVDLGFVHSIVIKHPEVNVVLALPEPQCPFIEYFVDQIRRTVKRVDGIERVLVTFLDGPATELTIEEPEMI